jgi:hypothetical protein
LRNDTIWKASRSGRVQEDGRSPASFAPGDDDDDDDVIAFVQYRDATDTFDGRNGPRDSARYRTVLRR